MQTISPFNTQTFQDIALMYYGSVVFATDIAHANGMCITDDITGLTINLPEIGTTADDKKTVKEISKLTSPIATKLP